MKNITSFNEDSMNIYDLMKRRNNGEQLSINEDWRIHCWLYDNDEIYKKAWEESVDRLLENQ